MKDRSPLSLLIRGFLLVVLIVLVVIALVSMISWWAGWMFLEEFQRAIYLVGGLLIGTGLVGLAKELVGLHHSRLADGQTETTSEENQALMDGMRRYAFTVIFLVAGGVCLLIGVLLI